MIKTLSIKVIKSIRQIRVVHIPCEDYEFGCYDFPAEQTSGWTNKMFVRADLMPHQIRITNVRVERLQDISDEDCIKEGVEIVPSFVKLANGDEKRLDYYKVPIFCKSGRVLTLSGNTPREVFAKLINRVSGWSVWQDNLYVFAYDFELVK